MQITIDLSNSPAILLADLTRAVRFALGANYYIEEGDSLAFTAQEIADPNVNLQAAPVVAGALPDSTLPPVAAAPNANAAATDSAGNVWDVRIHSGGKSTIADGTWKLKKGVDKTLVEQVNAQNRQLMATRLPTANPSNVVALPSLAPLAGAAAELPGLPALPNLPPVAQVAAPDVEITVTDYTTFAAYVAQQMVAKPVATKRELDKGLKHYGMVDAAGEADLTAMAHRPDVVMPFYEWLKSVIGLCAG